MRQRCAWIAIVAALVACGAALWAARGFGPPGVSLADALPPGAQSAGGQGPAGRSLRATAAVGIEKVASVSRAVRGMPITYTVYITNNDAFAYDPLVLTDTLPADFHYVSGSGQPAPDSTVEPLLVWQTLGPLAAGESLSVTFAVTSTAGFGTYDNTAEAAGFYVGGVLTDTATAPVDIVQPSVAIQKRVVPPGGVDGIVTITIGITNTGPSTIAELPLGDAFSPELFYLGGSPPADSFDNATGSATWTDLTTPPPLSDLAPGDSLTVCTVFSITTQGATFTATNRAAVPGGLDEFGNTVAGDDDTLRLEDVPTAVELLYLRATPLADAVRLEWATAVEIDSCGFRIYRAAMRDRARADLVASVPAEPHGDTTYAYVDPVPGDGQWWYWLADVDTAGRETFHGPVGAVTQAAEGRYQTYLPLILR